MDVLSSLPELSVRAAPAAMNPTQAPNIDPNRKTVANVTEQPPQQLIAFVGSIARTARSSAHSPTLGGVAKIGSAVPALTQRVVVHLGSKNLRFPTRKRWRGYNTLRF